jgi:TRAP transporter TAXI family solute receptor
MLAMPFSLTQSDNPTTSLRADFTSPRDSLYTETLNSIYLVAFAMGDSCFFVDKAGIVAREMATPRSRAALSLAFGLALVAGIWITRAFVTPRHETLRLATGSRGGTSFEIGKLLARSWKSRLPTIDIEVLQTPGGQRNVPLIEKGAADIGLVHGDLRGGHKLRVLACLYRETLQIVTRIPASRTAPEPFSRQALLGKRIAIGPRGSGTNQIARGIFRQFRVTPRVDSASSQPTSRPSSVVVVELSHDKAATALLRGKVDIVFVLAGIPAASVQRMLADSRFALWSLGQAEKQGSGVHGIRLNQPALEVTTIPKYAYGMRPYKAIGSLAVDALLVAREMLDETLAYRLTRALSENRKRLAEAHLLLARMPRQQQTTFPLPLHRGAHRFYHRNDPPLILAWADTFSLLITLLLLGWSGVAALRGYRRGARKHSIDVYYAEVQALGSQLADALSVQQLVPWIRSSYQKSICPAPKGARAGQIDFGRNRHLYPLESVLFWRRIRAAESPAFFQSCLPIWLLLSTRLTLEIMFTGD